MVFNCPTSFAKTDWGDGRVSAFGNSIREFWNGEYLGELRANARPLAAASLATGTSLPLFAYTNSVFAPHLIKDFGWSRSQFALIGITMLLTLPFLPFFGRLTDRFGVRKVALVGVLTMPLGFIGYSQMQGDFTTYLVLFTAVLIVGSMVGPLVFTRLIAANFVRAQGLALTVVNCTPAILALMLAPALNMCIEAIGWRATYLVLGTFVLICGLAAVWLVGKEDMPTKAPGAVQVEEQRPARQDYPVIFRSKLFWVLVFGFFLCLLQTQLHSSQMNLMLIENDLSMQMAANVVSIYALGTIVGRIACGLALDRYSTPIVTFLSMALPAIGFLLLASDMNSLPMVSFAMFLVGLSVGAESDLICYLVSRYFKLRIYGTTLGLVQTTAFLSSAVGGLAISLTLAMSDSYVPFLYLVAGGIALGSLLFLMLPKEPDFEKIG
jgi:MFS family permease